jgi:hypothetical protein
MKFEFLHSAAREFEEALDWYAQRSAKAAAGFRAQRVSLHHRSRTQPQATRYWTRRIKNA